MGDNSNIPRYLEMKFSSKFITSMLIGIVLAGFVIFMSTYGISGRVWHIKYTTPQITTLIMVFLIVFFVCSIIHAFTWSLTLEDGDISIKNIFGVKEYRLDDIDADKCQVFESGKNYGITIKTKNGKTMFNLNAMMIGSRDFINILEELKTAKN